MLTESQYRRMLLHIMPFMAEDRYGQHTIRNIYFDTENYRLIRNSIEKPVYKEKLRLRSYRSADRNTMIFVELKKKYDSIVYKRRVSMAQEQALHWLCQRKAPPTDGQIEREITYLRDYYQTLQPKVFLSYDRQAYYGKEDPGLRITFDRNILCRTEALFLSEEPGGIPILAPEKILMEIKSTGGMPLWLTHILTAERLFKTSYSKYGSAYERLILPNFQGGMIYA